MTRASLVSIAPALVSILLALLALAAPASAVADSRVAAVVAPDGTADIRTATVIGPSGQLYAGDGTGRWVRSTAGGIAGDVTGAIRVDGALIVAGETTPMYRFDGTGWSAHKLGQSGRTVLGSGPWPSVAIGRHVFLYRPAKGQLRAGWIRIGEIPGPVIAVWAQSARKVLVVTPLGVHTLRDKVFTRTRDPVAAIVGAAPWAIVPEGAVNLAARGQTLPATGVVAVTAGATTPWLLASTDPTAPLQLIGRTGTLARTITSPIAAGTAIVDLAADAAGRLVIAAGDGVLHIWADDRWSTGSLVDELPAARPGPGPAPTR